MADPLCWAIRSDPGPVREKNQDWGEVREIPLETTDGECALVAVVADGMGGHSAGEVASQMAVGVVMDLLATLLPVIKLTPAGLTLALRKAVIAANRDVFRAANDGAELRGMGTTLTIALLYRATLYVAHVGDSRAYLVHAGAIDPLTKDHTVVQQKVDDGILTEQEARHSLERNQLLRAIGTDEVVEVDVSTHGWDDRDALILATDGAYSSLEASDLVHATEANAGPDAVCADLLQRAVVRDGSDNLTVVCVRRSQVPKTVRIVEPPPSRQRTRASGRPLFVAVLLVLLVAGASAVAWHRSRLNREAPAEDGPAADSGEKNATAVPDESILQFRLSVEVAGGRVRVAYEGMVDADVSVDGLPVNKPPSADAPASSGFAAYSWQTERVQSRRETQKLAHKVVLEVRSRGGETSVWGLSRRPADLPPDPERDLLIDGARFVVHEAEAVSPDKGKTEEGALFSQPGPWPCQSVRLYVGGEPAIPVGIRFAGSDV